MFLYMFVNAFKNSTELNWLLIFKSLWPCRDTIHKVFINYGIRKPNNIFGSLALFLAKGASSGCDIQPCSLAI